MSSTYKTHSAASKQLKKLFQAVTIGAFAAASVTGIAVSAHADPPDHAPAYGYRAHQNGDYQGHGAYHHDDDDDDNDNDEHHRRGSDNRYGGRYNDGRYNGSYSGGYNGSYDNRYDNRYGNNNGRYNGSYTNQFQTLTGVVVDDRSGNEFTVRTSNGNTIRARAEDGEPGRLDEGDTVRLYGRYTNGIFLARNVDIVRDTSERDDRYNGRYNGGYNGGYNGSYNGGYNGNRGSYNDYGYGYGSSTDVNFPAVVTEVDKRNDTLRVRGDNGRTYTVRSGKADKFNKGDKVRIKGSNRNGVVYADKIEDR